MSQQKNKYYKGSHMAEAQFRQLIQCFALVLNALKAHKITNISHRSSKVIYGKLCMDG